MIYEEIVVFTGTAAIEPLTWVDCLKESGALALMRDLYYTPGKHRRMINYTGEAESTHIYVEDGWTLYYNKEHCYIGLSRERPDLDEDSAPEIHKPERERELREEANEDLYGPNSPLP